MVGRFKQRPRAKNAMRQKWRTDKFRKDKTVWMILISNDLLQLHRSVGDLCVDAAMYLRKAKRILCVAAFLASEMNCEPPDFANFLTRPVTDGPPSLRVLERLRPGGVAEFRLPEMLEHRDSEVGARGRIGRDQPRQADAGEFDLGEAAEIPIR